jgi:NTE family protein
MTNQAHSLDQSRSEASLSPYRGAAPSSVKHLIQFYRRSRKERTGVALCLSGGGYRAALFHLGGLRRLNELGVLANVDAISAVSGGSILAAVLADKVGDAWPTAETVNGDGSDIPENVWYGQVEECLLDFTSHDIRTKAVAKRYLTPLGWLQPSTAVDSLAHAYLQITKKTLGDLPQRPEFIFGASELRFGRYWTFARGHGGATSSGAQLANPSAWPVARAVAASSCFPPVFDPMRVNPEELKGSDVEDIYLSDGGLFDNMGYAAIWEKSAYVLVSDGGGQFQQQWKNFWPWRFLRYVSIQGARSGQAQKTWLLSNQIDEDQGGAFWGLGSNAASFSKSQAPGYSQTITQGYIHRIRTDLNRFSPQEQAVLMNHGYLLADAAIRTHAPELARRLGAPLVPPNEALLNNPGEAQAALQWSHSSWFGPRLLDRIRRSVTFIWRYAPHGPADEGEMRQRTNRVD